MLQRLISASLFALALLNPMAARADDPPSLNLYCSSDCPRLYNFDYPYIGVDASNLFSSPIKLQARVNWSAAPTGGAHAGVGYVQGANTSSVTNSGGTYIWTNGVGAFVGDNGLNLELWFNSGHAYTWNQNALCGIEVPSGVGIGVCISTNPNDPNGFVYTNGAAACRTMTGAWVPNASEYYWVRITVGPSGYSGYLRLFAELFQDCNDPSGPRPVQTAAINFLPSQFLYNGSNVNGAVFRAFGPADPLFYYAFNYGY